MAGTSITVRLPSELAKWTDDQPGTRTEVLVRALTALRDGVTGDGPDQRPVVLQAMVANLEAVNARLTQERDQWRDLAKAIVAKAIVSAGKEPINAVSTKVISAHPSGPVYEPKLSVSGTTRPMFRAGSEAEKAMKSSQK